MVAKIRNMQIFRIQWSSHCFAVKPIFIAVYYQRGVFMRYMIGLAAGILLSGCVATTSPPAADANRSFQTLAESAWDFNRRQHPPTAAYLGDKSAEGKLMDMSPEALARRYNTRKDYYQQIEAIPADQLSEANQINREMILYALRNQLSDYEYQMY